jgi:hypothetical protein
MRQTMNLMAAVDRVLGFQDLHLADHAIMLSMPSGDALALNRVIAKCAANMPRRWPTPPDEYPMRQR